MISVSVTIEQIKQIIKALETDPNRDPESLTLLTYLHGFVQRDRKYKRK